MRVKSLPEFGATSCSCLRLVSILFIYPTVACFLCHFISLILPTLLFRNSFLKHCAIHCFYITICSHFSLYFSKHPPCDSSKKSCYYHILVEAPMIAQKCLYRGKTKKAPNNPTYCSNFPQD